MPLLDLPCVSLMISYGAWGRSRGEVSFLSRHGLSLGMLTWKQCLLSGSLTVKLLSGNFKAPTVRALCDLGWLFWGEGKAQSFAICHHWCCIAGLLLAPVERSKGTEGVRLIQSILYSCGERMTWENDMKRESGQSCDLSLGLEILLSQSPIC